MSGRIRYDDILGALARRYDFHSAHAILLDALRHAGMTPAESYSPEEASRIVWGLNMVGQRAQPAVMALFELVGEAATAGPPDEADEDPDEVQDLDNGLSENVPLIIAQVVEAAVASAAAKARARAAAARSTKIAAEPPGNESDPPAGEEAEERTRWN